MSKYIMCNECEMCDGDRCTYFDNDSDRESTLACILFKPKNPTLFHSITQSPEVLAESLVFWEGGWTSRFIKFTTTNREEAIAATVEKLKEVEK